MVSPRSLILPTEKGKDALIQSSKNEMDSVIPMLKADEHAWVSGLMLRNWREALEEATTPPATAKEDEGKTKDAPDSAKVALAELRKEVEAKKAKMNKQEAYFDEMAEKATDKMDEYEWKATTAHEKYLLCVWFLALIDKAAGEGEKP